VGGELVRGFVMKALDGRFLDRTVHPFYLAVGPRVRGLGKALLDAPLVAELSDRVAAQVGMLGHVPELQTVVSQQFMYFVWNLGQYPSQECHGHGLGGMRVQLGEGPLARAVN